MTSAPLIPFGYLLYCLAGFVDAFSAKRDALIRPLNLRRRDLPIHKDLSSLRSIAT